MHSGIQAVHKPTHPQTNTHPIPFNYVLILVSNNRKHLLLQSMTGENSHEVMILTEAVIYRSTVKMHSRAECLADVVQAKKGQAGLLRLVCLLPPPN